MLIRLRIRSAVLMGVDMLRRLDRLVQQPGAGGTALKAVGKRL